MRPRVSIICIAKTQDELAMKQNQLHRQTLQDFEFVGEAGGTIPEAWNRAIARARGEILVFTETDATPVSDQWLSELVEAVTNERTIVKGLEITGLPWDMSNLACYRTVLAEARFDESFLWAEDSELFCRLKKAGYELVNAPVAPVLHLRKMRSKRLIRRAFRYGVYQARLRHRYQDPILVAGVEEAAKKLVAAALTLLGLAVGRVVYWPERFRSRAGSVGK